MKRIQIESYMKQKGLRTIDLVLNENDPLGIYCELKGGFLCDYTGHRINRNADVWGYLDFRDCGKNYREPVRVAFERFDTSLK